MLPCWLRPYAPQQSFIVIARSCITNLFNQSMCIVLHQNWLLTSQLVKTCAKNCAISTMIQIISLWPHCWFLIIWWCLEHHSNWPQISFCGIAVSKFWAKASKSALADPRRQRITASFVHGMDADQEMSVSIFGRKWAPSIVKWKHFVQEEFYQCRQQQRWGKQRKQLRQWQEVAGDGMLNSKCTTFLCPKPSKPIFQTLQSKTFQKMCRCPYKGFKSTKIW